MKRQENVLSDKAIASLRLNEESVQVGRAILGTLNDQSESLNRSEGLLDDSQYMVKRTQRIIRGMSWRGWLYNIMTKDPEPQQTISSDNNRQGEVNQAISSGFICPECRVTFLSCQALTEHYNLKHEVRGSNLLKENIENKKTNSFNNLRDTDQDTCKSFPGQNKADSLKRECQKKTPEISSNQHMNYSSLSPHTAFLEALEPQLAELKEMSIVVSHALDAQNKQIDRIDNSVDHVSDEMKAVTMQAAKAASSKLQSHCHGKMALQHDLTNMFINVIDGIPIVNSSTINESGIFRVFSLYGGTEAWGFQNIKSFKYLGVNRYGNVRVQANELKSYEQFSVNMEEESSALYCYASFFGLGGWICVSDDYKLYFIRGTPENKYKAAKFKFIPVE